MITKGTLVRFNEFALNYLNTNSGEWIKKIIGEHTNPLYWRGIVEQVDILLDGSIHLLLEQLGLIRI